MKPGLHLALIVVLSLLPSALLVLGCKSDGGAAVPAGMIAMFEGACPEGWSRYEPLDGRFPRGAESAGAIGGQVEHTHTFDITARTSNDGDHVHMIAGGENIEVDNGFYGNIGILKGHLQAFEEGGRDRTSVQRARAITDTDGAHDHLISVAGDAEAADVSPPYLDLIFCRKN